MILIRPRIISTRAKSEWKTCHKSLSMHLTSSFSTPFFMSHNWARVFSLNERFFTSRYIPINYTYIIFFVDHTNSETILDEPFPQTISAQVPSRNNGNAAAPASRIERFNRFKQLPTRCKSLCVAASACRHFFFVFFFNLTLNTLLRIKNSEFHSYPRWMLILFTSLLGTLLST